MTDNSKYKKSTKVQGKQTTNCETHGQINERNNYCWRFSVYYRIAVTFMVRCSSYLPPPGLGNFLVVFVLFIPFSVSHNYNQYIGRATAKTHSTQFLLGNVGRCKENGREN